MRLLRTDPNKANIALGRPVTVEGRVSYLYLPQSTCIAITRNLPVKFEPKLGLSLWNVDDLQYKIIATSPAFLSFTFRLNESTTSNVTIKVTFSLLNLLLEAPMVKKQVSYFPCSHGPGPNGVYMLGKAFMQAVSISVNVSATALP